MLYKTRYTSQSTVFIVSHSLEAGWQLELGVLYTVRSACMGEHGWLYAMNHCTTREPAALTHMLSRTTYKALGYI